MVVINNEPGSNLLMSMDDSTLPSVLVSPVDGAVLIETITTSPDVELTIGSTSVISVDSTSQDWVANFSSLGPNGDDSFIKPDLAAPGVAILSATSAEDSSSLGLDFTRLSGTSMASPMVAGAAVLLKQYAPELTPLQVKSILVNSVDAVSKNSTGERDATAFETGTGRLNILNALQATTYAVTPNMVAQPCLPSCSVTNELSTLSDISSTWTATVTFDNENVTGSISPSELTLTSNNKSDTFTLNVNAPLSLEEDWYFGRVQWTNNEGEIINQAVAINNQINLSDLLQLSVTDNGTKKEITLVSNNISGNEAIELGFTLTGEPVFVDDSFTVIGGDSHQVTIELEQQISVTANVSSGTTAGGISLESAPIDVNLEDEGIEAIECDIESSEVDGCDEVLFGIDFNFTHFEQSYSLFYISENGFVVAGDDIGDESALYDNLAFPNEGKPDNIIAPFWSDFDLINPNLSGDTGGGEMFVAIYEQDGIQYLVIQWNKAKLYTDDDFTIEYLGISSADVEFTFQLILQADSDNKWFRYIDIPEQPNYYSVGMENSTGTQGYTHWFDGDGVSQVTSGDELFAQSGELGSIILNVDVEAEFTQDDTAEVVQSKSVTINVLDNDTVLTENGILTTSVNDISQSNQLFTAASELNQSSLAIESQPENGEVVVSDGAITYTPDNGFSGSDQFTYSVADDLGQESSATVTVEVEPKKEDEGFLGLSLGIYLQGLLIFLMLLRRSITRRASF